MATFTTTDGVGLHYTDDGDGPPVLLLAGHRVIALDRGRSMCLDQAEAVSAAMVEFLR